jgi:hypothetical protein
MGNTSGSSNQDPLGGRRIIIVSQNGVTIDGQPIQPEQFQQFQQQMNFNMANQPNQNNANNNNTNPNNNNSSNNLEPSAPDQDDDSDSDSYYSDSDIDQEGINYANYVEAPNGQQPDVDFNPGQQQQQQGVPFIIFNTSGHSSRASMPNINHHRPAHMNPSHPSHPNNPLNPNNYFGVHQTAIRNSQQLQKINERNRENERVANIQRNDNMRRMEQQRWQQNFNAQTRRIQAQNNPYRPPPRPPAPPPVFRRR